jgi:hypothetical protein
LELKKGPPFIGAFFVGFCAKESEPDGFTGFGFGGLDVDEVRSVSHLAFIGGLGVGAGLGGALGHLCDGFGVNAGCALGLKERDPCAIGNGIGDQVVVGAYRLSLHEREHFVGPRNTSYVTHPKNSFLRSGR